MAQVCPKCSSPKVVRSSSFAVHWIRTLTGSRRRRCLGCGSRWFDPSQRAPTGLLAGAAACAAFFVIDASRWLPGGHNPVVIETLARGPVRDPLNFAEDASPAIPTRKESAEPAVLTTMEPDTTAPQVRNTAGSQAIPAAPKPKAGFFGRFINNLRLMISPNPRKYADPRRGSMIKDLNSMSKRQLWDKYGGNFGSKEEAKAAYGQYKGSGKLPGE